eukprot:TRINITY_DN9856_c1_g1_i1.p1 TRINITY_DN9856_c1_g1~~TRINITY_DN9856_c1_g1_i1.p1  ORF type:complete len:1037 (+),score=412.62 TRINITY_DN9856_c1_g1_i1:73-3111(+)
MPPHQGQQWPVFKFFDASVVQEDVEQTAYGRAEPTWALRQTEVSCVTAGLGKVIFGDHEGMIHVCDRSFRMTSFQGYTNQVTHAKQLRKHNVLVTIGDEQGGSGRAQVGVLKVWQDVPPAQRDHAQPPTLPLFHGIEPPRAEPLVMNVNPALDLRLVGNSAPPASADGEPAVEGRELHQSDVKSPITCFDVTEDKMCVACGLTDGSVLISRGDVTKQVGRQKSRRLPSASGQKSPVTWVCFRKLFAGKDTDPRPQSTGGVLTHDTYVLYVMYKDKGVMYTLPQSDREAPAAPAVLDGCLGCDPGCACLMEDTGEEGPRLLVAKGELITKFGGNMGARGNAGADYLWPGTTAKRIGTFRSYLWIVASERESPVDRLTIFDTHLKIRAVSPQTSSVNNLVCAVAEWGSIFLLCQDDGAETVSQKLHQYQEKDMQTKLEMVVQRNKYDIAIELAQAQDCESHLVTDMRKKCADWYCAPNKCDYRLAVEQYIRTIGSLEPSYVIRKFLDAQRIQELTVYLEALYKKGLANGDHTTLLLNCYTKLKQRDKLDEFVGLNADGAQSGAHKLHVETAIKVCRQAGYIEHAERLAKSEGNHTWYLLILIEDQQKYVAAIDYIKSLKLADAETQLLNYGKVLLAKLPDQTREVLIDICTGWPVEQTEDGVTVSDPDQFLPCFVDAPHSLMSFLDSVLHSRPRTDGRSATAENTLLELFLTKDLRGGDRADGDDAEARRERATALLKDASGPKRYDNEHALVLVQMHDHHDGILHLYKEMEMYQDILQFHMQRYNYAEAMQVCSSFAAESDPNMWVQLLHFLADVHGNEVEIAGKKEVQDVSSYIQIALQSSQLPPLQVVQILSKNPKVKLETVSEHVLSMLQHEIGEIERCEEKICEHQAETHKMRTVIQGLQCNAQTFQSSRCSRCHQPLALPAVHFMCKHSYHQDCIDRENECPNEECSREYARVTTLKRQLDDQVEQHDAFFQQLKDAQGDGFSVIAKYFGRAIFNGEYTQPRDRRSFY